MSGTFPAGCVVSEEHARLVLKTLSAPVPPACESGSIPLGNGRQSLDDSENAETVRRAVQTLARAEKLWRRAYIDELLGFTNLAFVYRARGGSVASFHKWCMSVLPAPPLFFSLRYVQQLLPVGDLALCCGTTFDRLEVLRGVGRKGSILTAVAKCVRVIVVALQNPKAAFDVALKGGGVLKFGPVHSSWAAAVEDRPALDALWATLRANATRGGNKTSRLTRSSFQAAAASEATTPVQSQPRESIAQSAARADIQQMAAAAALAMSGVATIEEDDTESLDGLLPGERVEDSRGRKAKRKANIALHSSSVVAYGGSSTRAHPKKRKEVQQSVSSAPSSRLRSSVSPPVTPLAAEELLAITA
jgi:hypothetical protein